jgi:hypothetical protein
MATLASSGLTNEGVYLAVKTLAEGWQQPAADSLLSGFRSGLAQSGKQNLAAWQKIIASQLTHHLADDLVSQVAVQSPEASDFIERGIVRVGSAKELGQQIVTAGTELINLGMYDAGLSLLSSAAYDKLAGVSAIPILRNAVARVPKRVAAIMTGKNGELVTRDLATAAEQLAATDHYMSALHTYLIEPLVNGDNDRFARMGKSILDAAMSKSDYPIGDTVDLALDLSTKGYRSQAVDFVTSSTGIPYADQSNWRKMFQAIREPRQASGTGRLTARIVPPLATRMGVDLSPQIPIDPVVVPEAVPVTPTEAAAQPSPRHVNCWIEESTDFPTNEFEIGVNIGPRELGAMGGRFTEPDWSGREHIDLRIVLSSPGAQVRPAWRKLRLPRTGKTEDIRFRVVSDVVGILELWLRVYADESNTLLDEHQLRISIAGSKQVA